MPEISEITLHGHRVAYRTAGSGPVVALIHGITGSCTTWDLVIDRLAEHHTVVAPDLLGHGASAKPRGDYSLGAYASGVRDLLAALGHDRATIVGHSLGGGIAMQFAYQYVARCERLVLVGSGGLGRDVSPVLRAAALPGSEWVLPVIAGGRVSRALTGLLGAVPPLAAIRPGLAELLRGYASLGDREARAAFVHTIRSVIDVGGQRVSARDRLYLAAAMPTMIVWGARDGIIPVEHAYAAHAAIPGSRLEVFERAGHFPHRDEPARFADVLLDFLATTEPAQADEQALRDQLLAGPSRAPAPLPG